jgi:hypothetical protein
LGGYKLDVPSGPHTLEISGACVQPESIAVDAEGATALSKLPSCDRLSPGNAPANALFAYEGCATTKSVTYDVVGGALVVRWHLVDPMTAEPTDVEVNFGPTLTVQDNVIEVAYDSLGDAGHDGSGAFVGLTTASGAAFPIGVRQAALRPFHAIQLTPTPTIHF